MHIEGDCAFCGAHFSYDRVEMRGGRRISCDTCKTQAQKRYAAKNVEKARLRKKAWRDRKRAELGIVLVPRVQGERRREIPLGLRFAILRRDKSTCQYCGRSAPEVALHVDHIVAVAVGGTNDPVNLITACSDCNSGKHTMVVA